MPHDFVKMHHENGDSSRLITLFRNTILFDEDICMNFKLPVSKGAKFWRDSKIDKTPSSIFKYNKPGNFLEKMYFNLRDEKNKKIINRTIKEYSLYDYDIYHFDGGLDFFRDFRFAKEIKKRGKKIVCCYYGSDLRTRGIFKEIDQISDLNLTVEFDHLELYKDINYIFFPFDANDFHIKKKNNKKIKIIHSPTNRKFKGTDKIIKIINEINNVRQIEFLLLENMERPKVLEIKAGCDLAIDQVGGELGGSGYGKNSVENLSLGVPTLAEFSEDYLKFIKENPFIHSTIDTLKDNLIRLIDNQLLRNDLALKGRIWVEKYHSYSAVNKILYKLYQNNNII